MCEMKKVKAVAPSSIMLFGEHAVLRGKTACVAAIDRYLTVEICSRVDTTIQIVSMLSSSTTTLDNIQLPHELRFVQKALEQFQEQIQVGFDVLISSEIPHTVGLGSSAAVTVAMIAALTAFVQSTIPIDTQRIVELSIKVIREVQGVASGADVASIVYGGVIAYRMKDFFVQRLTAHLPLFLMYSGYKRSTAEVIDIINEAEIQEYDYYQALFNTIEYITLQVLPLIREQRLQEIGIYMNRAHGLMESLGVSTKELSDLAWSIRQHPGVYGSKISGSGLGDSIVVLGNLKKSESFAKENSGAYIPITVSPCGVTVEIL